MHILSVRRTVNAILILFAATAPRERQDVVCDRLLDGARADVEGGRLRAGPQAFLLEVAVVRQYAGDGLIAAEHHRHAVGQAVALIEPPPVEIDAGEEELRRLVDDGDAWISSQRINQFDGHEASVTASLREIS